MVFKNKASAYFLGTACSTEHTAAFKPSRDRAAGISGGRAFHWTTVSGKKNSIVVWIWEMVCGLGSRRSGWGG